MSMSTVITRIVDALWAAGGIGAAAELGYEDFGSHLAQPALCACALPNAGVRGCRRLADKTVRTPLLEGELCLLPVARKSVRG